MRFGVNVQSMGHRAENDKEIGKLCAVSGKLRGWANEHISCLAHRSTINLDRTTLKGRGWKTRVGRLAAEVRNGPKVVGELGGHRRGRGLEGGMDTAHGVDTCEQNDRAGAGWLSTSQARQAPKPGKRGPSG